MSNRKEVNPMVGEVRRNCEEKRERKPYSYEKNISIKGEKEKYENENTLLIYENSAKISGNS